MLKLQESIKLMIVSEPSENDVTQTECIDFGSATFNLNEVEHGNDVLSLPIYVNSDDAHCPQDLKKASLGTLQVTLKNFPVYHGINVSTDLHEEHLNSQATSSKLSLRNSQSADIEQ